MADAVPLALAGDSGDAILARLLGAVAAEGYDVQAGTVEYVILRNAATELYGSGVVQALRVYQAMFIDTAPPGDPLTKKGDDYATPQLPATPAVHPVTFVGAPGSTYDAGTLFQTAATRDTPAQVFALQVPVTLDGSGNGAGSVRAAVAGTAGNVAANTIRFAVNSLPGLVSVTNPTGPSTPGTDDEDWETYRGRVKLAAARDPGRDNVAYYTALALAKPGGVEVGWVLVDVLWAGENTVRLVILHADGTIPTSDEVAAVQAAFDAGVTGMGAGIGGVGDFVTVAAPSEVDVRLKVNGLVLTPGITEEGARDNLERAVADYLRLQVNPGGVVMIHGVENAIHDAAGVQDFGVISLSVDGGSTYVSANIPLTPVQKAVLIRPASYVEIL